MMIRVYKPYTQVFIDSEGEWNWVWQPTSQKGICVLNAEAKFIFDLVDGKRSVEDIWQECVQVDSRVTVDVIQKQLEQLEQSDLIWIDSPTTVTEKRLTTLGVWFHLTNQCNLRCTYCYVNKTNESMTAQRAKKILTNILTNAKEHEFKRVKIKFTGGEALLKYELLLEIISYLKLESERLHIKADAVVLTNAILMTEERALQLKTLGVRIMISLDGLQPHHDAVRVFANGSGSYTQVMKGIDAVMSANIPFNLSITVTEKNIAGIPELTRLLLDKQIPFVYNFFRENCMAGSELTTNDQVLIDTMKKAYAIIEDNLPSYPMIGGLLDRVTFGKPHLRACGVGRNYLVVDHMGNLAVCQTRMDQRIGTIDDEDLIGLMQTQNILSLPSVDERDHCRTCPWRYICGGGCPLLNDYPYCRVYKALVPELLRLEAKRLIQIASRKLSTMTY